jgi:hypothetical protein
LAETRVSGLPCNDEKAPHNIDVDHAKSSRMHYASREGPSVRTSSDTDTDSDTTDPRPLTMTSALDPPAAVLEAEGIGFDSNSGLEVVELSGSIVGRQTEVAVDVGVVVVEEQGSTISAAVVVVVAAAVAAVGVEVEENSSVRAVAGAAGRSQSVVEVKVAEVAPAAAAGVDVVG